MNEWTFTRRTLIVLGLTVLVLVLLLFFRSAGSVLLLTFASILLAVFLNALARMLRRPIPVSYRWALITVTVLLLVISTGFWVMVGPNIADQVDRLVERLPESLETVEARIRQYGLGEQLWQSASEASEAVSSDSGVVSRITGAFSSTLSGLANLLIIFVVGLYLAFSPELYIDGSLRLVPPGKRDRARDVVRALGRALRRWIVGRAASMLVVGVLTMVGLMLLGVPLALTLGVLAALLSFIPNLGPILALIPAVLVAMMESPQLALYVVILYMGVQTVESYMITPLIQKKAVSLPPALLLLAQILMGVMYGIFGLLLATPILVSVIVLIQMLYVEDVLGDDVEVLGQGNHDD